MDFVLAKQNDKDEVLRLYSSVLTSTFCVWNKEYPGAFEFNLDCQNNDLFLLKDDDEIIGAVSIVEPKELDEFPVFKISDNSFEIGRICIRPEDQEKGYSHFLLDFIKKEIQNRKGKSIHLSVAKKNIPGVKLYQSEGFTFVGETFMYGNDYYLCEYQY